MNRKKDVILRATVALTENYKKEEMRFSHLFFVPLFQHSIRDRSPDRKTFNYVRGFVYATFAALNRNWTASARVQVLRGLKVVSEVPSVRP